MDPFLLQAGIDTPAKFFEAYGFYDDLSTGLGGGFDFNNPLEPPSSPAHTGNQAIMAHHDDFNSLMEGVEGYDPYSQCFTDGGFAFGEKYLRPAFEQSKEKITWGGEPQYSDLEEEVSVEDTDSEEDRRPASSAWKRPVVGSWSVSTGSVRGEGEQPSSDGVPHADTPEWQQDEDDEEFEGDDDEFERPARLSGAPAPTISSRKASAWSDAEDVACIKFMKEVCTLAQYAAIAGTEKRFEVVADRMKREAGFNRTASGVKLQWNRRLRAASKFEDRGEKKRASGLTTSALGQGTKRGTSAVTSLVSSNPRGKKSSATSAQSTETSSLSGRKGKRKATYIDSDDEADDDDFFAASRPYPAKHPRIASEASSSALPSTQDVAYYDLSTANILSGPRASRYRPSTTAQATNTAETPRRSSCQQPITTTNDDADDEEEAPEPNYNSKAFWQDVLRKRQARVARQREEYERQQQQEEEESEEDEPVITTADRARKSGELRKQKTSTTKSASATEPASTTRSSSANRPSSSTRSSSATRHASTTRPTSTTTSSSTTTTGPSYPSRVSKRRRSQASSTTRTSARRFARLSSIAEDAEHSSNSDNNNATRAVYITPATAAQIAADEEIARQMQEEWNEEPARRARRARRGRGFR